eukprot:1937557-Prymnesium_polylepis.1
MSATKRSNDQATHTSVASSIKHQASGGSQALKLSSPPALTLSRSHALTLSSSPASNQALKQSSHHRALGQSGAPAS